MNKTGIFLRGILMGICDVIPGISGGTIAFITGIYERLINAISNIVGIPKDLLGRKKSLIQCVKDTDLGFLIPLFLGIALAIILGSKIITWFLENHLAFTLSFFVGLIIASSKIIYDHISERNGKNLCLGMMGVVLGGVLAIAIPTTVNPSTLYIFLGGFVAISAMFLPGISGSFILLIMGIYDYLLNVLHNIKEYFVHFVVFLLGAACGAIVISRVIAYLFKKDKCATLSFLLGLVIGSLSIPIKRVVTAPIAWTASSIIFTLICAIAGIVVVYVVHRFTCEAKNE
jgi:putative membrane protein